MVNLREICSYPFVGSLFGLMTKERLVSASELSSY